MQCPACTTETLVMAERQGIEIDYCPKCRGVWLDRGELDKLIERSAAQLDAPPASAPRPAPAAQAYPEPQRGYQDDRRHPQHYPYKKRKGLLGELFDFD